MENHDKPLIENVINRAGLTILAVFVVGTLLWATTRGNRPTLLAQSPLPTPTATIGPTLTPGPTATKVKRIVNEITHPTSGDAMAGNAEIRGTVVVERFLRFDLHLSPAGQNQWQWLVSTYDVIYDDMLYVLDTTQFPDGVYDLRARAIQVDGGYTESFVSGLEIRNARPPTLTPVPGATPTPVSPLVTPTATPDTRRVPGGQGFYGPDSGTVVRGVVDIIGTVNGPPENPFVRYELHVAPAGTEAWKWLYSGLTQVWQQPIYQFDSTVVADGLYDFRLRIVYRDSNYNEYYLRNVSVANQGQPNLAFVPAAGISSPRSGATVSGVVDLIGTVPEADLLRWELYWSPFAREEWNFLIQSDRPVDQDLLARLDLSQLPSGRYDLRLRVVRTDTNYTDYLVRELRVQSGP